MATVARSSAPQFPVLFRLHDAKTVAGSLTVTAHGLTLDGGAAAFHVHRQIGFDDLREVRIVRKPEERLAGYVSLAVPVRDEPPLLIAPLGHGLLHEIVDLLATFTSPSPAVGDRVAVVVPLATGTEDDVRALVAKGPPVDPGELGLRMHEVWLDERSHAVVFVFEGDDARRKVERAARRPALWRAGLAWRCCIAGHAQLVDRPPQNAGELLYRWQKAD
jgi:hypothetical protein